MADEVARIGALSNGSNGQRSLESASLHFSYILANVVAPNARLDNPELIVDSIISSQGR
jgi:hypothetical protein